VCVTTKYCISNCITWVYTSTALFILTADTRVTVDLGLIVDRRLTTRIQRADGMHRGTHGTGDTLDWWCIQTGRRGSPKSLQLRADRALKQLLIRSTSGIADRSCSPAGDLADEALEGQLFAGHHLLVTADLTESDDTGPIWRRLTPPGWLGCWCTRLACGLFNTCLLTYLLDAFVSCRLAFSLFRSRHIEPLSLDDGGSIYVKSQTSQMRP